MSAIPRASGDRRALRAHATQPFEGFVANKGTSAN
jgi:hypothetical protein